MLPGERDLVRVQDLEPVGKDALARVATSRESALRWVEDGRLWTDLALARLMSVERKRVVRADLDLVPVRHALVEGLKRAPINPYAWSRLAYIDYAVEGAAGRGAARVLPVAILSGPSERRLYLLRAEVGLRLFGHLDHLDRPLVLRQVELAWRQDPFAALDVAHATGRVDLLRRALAGAPDQREILRKLLAKGY